MALRKEETLNLCELLKFFEECLSKGTRGQIAKIQLTGES